MTDLLDGRRVLVTGASSGIGAACASAIVAAGGRVGLIARRATRLAAACEQLGPAAEWTAADVTDETTLRPAVDALAARLGGLDGVLPAAGTSLFSSMVEGDPADWRHVIEVDLLATLTTVRCALDHFADDGPRDVVLVGSTGAETPHPALTAYAAAKRGLEAYADGLRLELAPRWIRVAVLVVGATATEIVAASRNQGVDEATVASTAAGRFRALRPEDVADAALYALSRPEKVAVNRLTIRPNGQLT